MTQTIKPAPVRKTLTVAASPQRAFEVFTAGFDRWWPRSHTIGAAALKTAIIEPRQGGRWYGIDVDGGEASGATCWPGSRQRGWCWPGASAPTGNTTRRA